MATYCFRCRVCGATRERSVREPFTYCTCPGRPKMVRDYRAEQTQLVVPGEFLHNPLPEDGPVV